MYEYLIKEYVKKIEINDIYAFARNNAIIINQNDAEIFLYYIKNHYKELISNNPNNILKEIKKKIDPTTYDRVYKLYLIYRNQYLFK